MRPGPDEKLLTQGVTVGVRVAIMRGSRVLATDVPAVNVQLDVSADSVVPEKLSYDAPLNWLPRAPLDPLNSFGQRSHVTVIQEVAGQRFETALGWFTHGSRENPGWTETDSSVQVTGFGLLQLAEDDPLPWPSSPPVGQLLSREFCRLSNIPIILDGVADVIVPRTSQWGTSRTEAVRDLADSYGLDYRVEPDGYLHVFPTPDPYHQMPVAVYEGVVIDAPREGMPRRANRVVVTGSGEKEAQYTSTSALNVSPYDGDYGRVTERVELSGTSTARAVADAAAARQRMMLFSTQVRSVMMVPDPRIEIDDLITCIADSGEIITGRVIAYSWSQNQQMRVDVEVATYG